MERIKIVNGRVITPFRIIENGTVLVEKGQISFVGQGNIDFPGAHLIDVQNNFVSPGFIDIHTHGGGGHDFMDGTVEAFLEAAKMHAQHGTTSMVPTTLATETEDLIKTFSVYREAKKLNIEGAQLLGLHLEGPYFSINQKGAQDERYIRLPKREEYEAILSHSQDIIRWSAAPEIEGANEFGRFISQQNYSSVYCSFRCHFRRGCRSARKRVYSHYTPLLGDVGCDTSQCLPLCWYH